MFHKILVAIDQSQINQQVFDKAVSLASATDARLMFLHVLSPFDEYYLKPGIAGVECAYPNLYSGFVSSSQKEWEDYELEGIEWLKSLTHKALLKNVKTEFTQNCGDPGRIICTMARNWQADLIIMGRRGRTGLSELFLGSVSNYVLHHAPCTVMVEQQSTDAKMTEVRKVVSHVNS